MIYDITKCLSGNVLGIGVDEKISDILSNNDLVLNCNLLNSVTSGSGNGEKKRLKKIGIKKLRKVFKKKKVDFILCNIDEINKYIKTFVKDSIFINRDMLYIYNIKSVDLKNDLIKRYRRYNTIVEEINDNDSFILKIDNKNSNTNVFKDIFYLVIDSFIQVFNIISDLLMN